MTEENTKKYYQKLSLLSKKLDNEDDLLKKIEIQKEIENCHVNFLKLDEDTKTLYDNRLLATSKRSIVSNVPVNVDIRNVFREWVAPHELKDYGDTDELVYRMLFANSYIKIVLHVPDVDGVLGEKIFYVHNNMHKYRQEKVILVAEQDWIAYMQK